MNERREDDALRERFRELRAEASGSARVPDFDAMIVRAHARADARAGLAVVAGGAPQDASGSPPRRRLLRAGAWASVAVAATVAALLLTDLRADDDVAFEQLVASYSADISSGGLRSPTSGLLEVPGMDLTRSIPSIGGPLRGLDESTLPPREALPPEESL